MAAATSPTVRTRTRAALLMSRLRAVALRRAWIGTCSAAQISFEDLVHKSTRHAVLRQMTDFVMQQGEPKPVRAARIALHEARRAQAAPLMLTPRHVTTGGDRSPSWQLATDEALSCAFKLADSPHIHRSKSAEQNAQVASIEDAYANRTLVCLMWQLFRRKAAKVGYRPFGGVKC